MNDDLRFVKVRTTTAAGIPGSVDDVEDLIANLTDGLPRTLRWQIGKAVRVTVTVEVADA